MMRMMTDKEEEEAGVKRGYRGTVIVIPDT